MDFYDFVVSVIGLPSKELPIVGIGRVRKRLGGSRVRMKNNKDSHKNVGKGSLWRACGLSGCH